MASNDSTLQTGVSGWPGRVEARISQIVAEENGGSLRREAAVAEIGPVQISFPGKNSLSPCYGDGDFVSKATDVLWKKELIELDEESRQKVREKLSKLRQLKEVDDNGSFLKLSQARNWSSGQDAAPTNPITAALEWERAREDRKKQSQLEYEALKRELSLMTAGVTLAVSAYCFIVLSQEATPSYGIGALASLIYLQLLYRHVDEVSEENVPQIFVQRRRKRIGITISDLQATPLSTCG